MKTEFLGREKELIKSMLKEIEKIESWKRKNNIDDSDQEQDEPFINFIGSNLSSFFGELDYHRNPELKIFGSLKYDRNEIWQLIKKIQRYTNVSKVQSLKNEILNLGVQLKKIDSKIQPLL